jgi:hypothetical protein
LSSNQLSKPTRSTHEPTSSLTRTSIRSPLRPKSEVHSNPVLASQKSIYGKFNNS